MILKNQTTSANGNIPKGFNFSSYYQIANLSSIIAEQKDSPNSNHARLKEAGVNDLIAGASVAKDIGYSKIGLLANAAQVLGPINNKKLLNYKFLAKPLVTTAANASDSISFAKAPKGELHPQGKGSYKQPTVANATIVYSEDIIKLISAFFKSIYCLISRPKFINTPDKIIIEILYYITIPDHNVFKWYNFIYNSATAKKVLRTPEVKEAIVRKTKKKPTIKTIVFKNFLIKKTLFKLNNTNIVNLYINKFSILFKLLQCKRKQLSSVALEPFARVARIAKVANATEIINKPIEFNLIRIHKSDYDSNILAQLFILILKKKNIRIAINKLYTKNNIVSNLAVARNTTSLGATQVRASNNPLGVLRSQLGMEEQYNFIPAYISGLYIKIGGRLMREPIIPRITTKKFEIGAIANGKVNFVDSARITKKNKKGAYTIKITYAQNFVSA